MGSAVERVNSRTPEKKKKPMSELRTREEKLAYAIFAVEHESDVCGFRRVIRTWGQADGFDRLFPETAGRWGDEDLPESPGDPAEVKEVPWVEVGDNLLELVFTISFHPERRAEEVGDGPDPRAR